MTILEALILGVVEGITEYLPVSSTGHLVVTAWLLGLDRDPETKRAVDAFNIIIQGGAILAVAGLYFDRVRAMLRGLAGRDRGGRRLLVNILVAFAPAVVFGLLLADLIEAHLFRPVPVVAALFLGGILLLLMRRWQAALYARQQAESASTAEDGAPRFIGIDELTWRKALFIGLLQCVAMWPGTSRSMMSIVGGMFTGLRPREAAEFSFLLGLPTLGGACAYQLFKSLRAEGVGFIDQLGGWMPVLAGIAAATVSAALAIRWLVGYLSRHGMALFGWYRIAVALLLVWLIWGQGMAIAG